MSSDFLAIEFAGGRIAYRPGEIVAGHVSWQVHQADSVEVRFLWRTSGRGTHDTHVVASTKVDKPASTGHTPFKYELRDSPYCFAGKLISLIWAVELVIEPGGRCIQAEFVMAPDAKTILLESLPQRP